MSIRTPESLLCGHCQRERAVHTCAGCKLQICPRCARWSWSECEQPVARDFQLGRWRRLVDVDPGGSLALVRIKWRRAYRLFDLRGLRYLASPHRVRAGRLRDTGELLVVDTQPVSAFGDHVWLTAGGIRLSDDQRDAVKITEQGATARLLCGYDCRTGRLRAIHYQPAGPVSYDRRRRFRISCKRAQIDICITDLESGSLRTITASQQDLLSAVAYDPDAGILAAGCWGKLFLFAERHGSFAPARQILIEASEVRWLATAGRRLVALCRRPHETFLALIDIADNGTPGPLCELSIPAPGLNSRRPVALDLAPDGRSLAIGLSDRTVAFCTLPERANRAADARFQSVTRLSGHTDNVRLIAFAQDGQLLISADDDSRVIMRPLLGAEYATRGVRVPLADPTTLPDTSE